MKRKITREMTIGLSILAVLVVVLGVVAARRFMRPGIPADGVIAAEERHEERAEEHRLKREGESVVKPDVLSPVATVRRDGFQQLDDPGHWKTKEKEKDKEGLAGAAALGFAVSDHPENGKPAPARSEERHDEVVAGSEERHKHDGERTSTYAPPELTPAMGDDRYSTGRAPESSVEHRKKDGWGSPAVPLGSAPAVGRGEPVVIQVSNGESAEGSPRPMDRYDRGLGEHLPPNMQHAETFVPEAPRGGFEKPGMAVNSDAAQHYEDKVRERDMRGNVAATDGMANDPDAAQRQAEKIRERELQAMGRPGDAASGRGGYGVEPPRVAPAPYYHGAPAGDAAAGYSPAPGGYQADRARQGGAEFREPVRPQIPLREDGMYEVQPNDSYWTISERVYGSGAYFRALAEQNRGKAARPDRLPPGLLISTPPIARLEKDYPDLCPRPNRRETVRNRAATATMAATAGGGRTYVVQEGDTLSSIARNELGKVSRWAEIYQINREALGKDYDYLTPGMRLVLPIRDTQSGDRTTRRDDNGPPLLR